MKKWAFLLSLAIAGFTIIPDPSEGCWRRRHQYAPCPPVYYPVYPPAGTVVFMPPVPAVTPAVPAVASAVPTVTIKGRTYRLLDTGDPGEFEDRGQPAAATAAGITGDDSFKGQDRLVPKTTIVDAEVEEFPTVAALLEQLLEQFPDDKMAGMGITRSTNTRVAPEKRNVRVTGFIHAFKKEKNDNDYHVILGDGPDADNPVYMNVEVSGIPVGGTNDNRKKLVAVRDEFKQAFGLGRTGPANFFKPHEPIPVRITGSLFWDVDHKPGVVGPAGMRPKTSWEIHPISQIEFR
jgi:hypothetical protein